MNKTDKKAFTFFVSMLFICVILILFSLARYENYTPIIKLNGLKNEVILMGEVYDEKGVKAFNGADDISSRVVVSGKIDSNKPGVYKLKYEVQNQEGKTASETRYVTVLEGEDNTSVSVVDGVTYVNGVILVNKNHGLPSNYDPKVNHEALKSLRLMQADASALGLDLTMVSGYRSYQTQVKLHDYYDLKYGKEVADTFSAEAGYSEHQTGLAFDVGYADSSFEYTAEAKWLENNCHYYGFIIRYPKGKADITGYVYEPWHVRYLGRELAYKVKESGLTLEEYLGVN